MKSATYELSHNTPQQFTECAPTGRPTSSYEVFPVSYRMWVYMPVNMKHALPVLKAVSFSIMWT